MSGGAPPLHVRWCDSLDQVDRVAKFSTSGRSPDVLAAVRAAPTLVR